jgi:hypothetical protein
VRSLFEIFDISKVRRPAERAHVNKNGRFASMLGKSAPSNTFPLDGLKAADSQRLPSRQVSGQNESADGTDLANSPSTGKGRDHSEQTHKTRKKRTLKDLVRACEKLGDMSDKSQLLAQWKLERKNVEWKAHPANVRLRKMIHELVLKLEQLDRDLQTQGTKLAVRTACETSTDFVSLPLQEEPLVKSEMLRENGTGRLMRL